MAREAAVLACLLAVAFAASCLDEKGAPVDWWFVYKLPHGFRYAYRDMNNAAAGGALEPYTDRELDCGNTGCALGFTLTQLLSNKAGLAYALYNDEPPTSTHARRGAGRNASSEGGHTKGVVVFNESKGFWLVHSVPKFPEIETAAFQWQASNEYGQTMLCISLDIGDINGIAKQLQVTYPDIYASNLPASYDTSRIGEFVSLIGKKHLQGTSMFDWRSAGGQTFLSFTKAPQWGADLYEDLVIPGLKVNAGFFWETWRRSPCALSLSLPLLSSLSLFDSLSLSLSLDRFSPPS
eukprot:m.196564 g.196564  ORF g.196564 m.196564 type:complete len:294 (+) comp15465_c2_seq3:1556-2437(+)